MCPGHRGRARDEVVVAIREHVPTTEHCLDERTSAAGASERLRVIHLDEEHGERPQPRERGILRDELEEVSRAADGPVLLFVLGTDEVEEGLVQVEQVGVEGVRHGRTKVSTNSGFARPTLVVVRSPRHPRHPRHTKGELPDARDGLTRKQRVVLWVLAQAQEERGPHRNVPLALLYGRVVEHVDMSIEELQEIVAQLGARSAT